MAYTLPYFIMKIYCNHLMSRVSLKDMRVTLFITVLLFLSTCIYAQSPALDPDYVVLDTTETFTGYWAGHRVGAVIETVRPIKWDVPEGGIFLNSVDTAGFNDQGLRPTGPFKQGGNFSLFDKALYRLDGIYHIHLIQNNLSSKLPVLVAVPGNNIYSFISAYFPIGDSIYADTNKIWLEKKSSTRFFGSDDLSTAGYLNSDSIADFVIISKTSDYSSMLCIWYGDSLFYKGEIDIISAGTDTVQVIRASQEEYALGVIIRHTKPYISDFNGDSIPDIVFLADSTYDDDNVPYGPKGPTQLIYLRGKLTEAGKRWEVDTVVVHSFPRIIGSYLMSDYLYSDGKVDLLFLTADTIYCINGEDGFLEKEIVLSQAQLKIPSPAKLDPKNFKGNGRGKFNWYRLFDAGNINGSGEHSFATFAEYQPDSSQSFWISYSFIYSGGKAADERSDALYGENLGQYGAFANFDSVWMGNNNPTGFLIGDPSHSPGGNGKLYYFKGRTDIPHKPDPRWTKSVRNNSDINTLSIIAIQNPTLSHGQFILNSASSGNCRLVLRDLLGRAIWHRDTYLEAEEDQRVSIGFSGVVSGMYVLELTQNSRSVTTRIVIIQ